MDLQTGRMSRRGQCKKCKITQLVIGTVNKMAYHQGYKSLKFLNRKRQPMLINPIDTLKGIGAMISKNVEALDQADEDYTPMLEPPEDKLNIDSGVDAEELVDILDNGADIRGNPGNSIAVEEDNPPEPQEDESESGIPGQSAPVEDDDDSVEVPSLVSEPESRPPRVRNSPERYNPASQESYMACVTCHHLQTQCHPPERTLEYEDLEVAVAATTVTYLQERCNGQLYNLKQGIMEFADEGVQAAKKELNQMHERMGFKAIVVRELTRIERQRTEEDLMLLTCKKGGNVKGRLVYNGKGSCSWVSRENKGSLMVLAESLMLTCTVDTNEGT